MKFYNKNFCFIILTVLLAVLLPCKAQNPSQIDVLTTDDGLSFRNVESIAQDSLGFMWFGTSQGLNRYDGYNFRVYDNDVENPYFIEEETVMEGMAVDHDGKSMWYAAGERLFKLDFSSNSVCNYGSGDGLIGKVISIHLDRGNKLWAVTKTRNAAGIKKLHLNREEAGRFLLVDSRIQDGVDLTRIKSDQNNRLWWSTKDGSFNYTADGKFLEKVILESYSWNSQRIAFIESFFDSQNHHYYFPKANEVGGILEYKPNLPPTHILPEITDKIFYAIDDKSGNRWFAAASKLWLLQPDGDLLDYTPELHTKLDFSRIHGLFVDTTNLLWVATDNGLFKIRTGKKFFTTLFKSKKSGWGNAMRAIFEDAQGTIYSFCESQTKILRKKLDQPEDALELKTEDGTPFELEHAAVFLAVDAAGYYAYAVGSSIVKINLSSGLVEIDHAFDDNLYSNITNPLLGLVDGRLLFGKSLSALTLYDPVSKVGTPVFKKLPLEQDIKDLKYLKQSRQENIVYIGTQNDGLLQINLKGTVDNVWNTTSSPSIPKNNILAVEERLNGDLWLGTYGGGLVHIAADKTTIKTYTSKDGLAGDNVVGILADADHNLWISTYTGLSHLDLNKIAFSSYFMADGLSHDEFNYSSTFKDALGNLYFGGMNGINKMMPSQTFKASIPPAMRFTTLTGYNSDTAENYELDLSQQDAATLTISPHDQYFEIQWTLPSYFNNQKNTYSTQLVGFENQWFSRGSASSIRYNKLPAGEYVLKVKGSDSRGVQSASILSLPITVKQIFYKQWWFIALVFLLFLGLTIGIFRYRLAQLVAMERLRTRISSNLHDDVGSLLSGLAMQTELMEMNAQPKDRPQLQKIAGISRNAISQMRDLVWSIDSRRETTQDLFDKIRELAEEQLVVKDIFLQMTVEGIKHPQRKLKPAARQDIYLIFKEAITNIQKHSNATKVIIHITETQKGTQLFLSDNGSTMGKGKSTGLGLDNIKMRVAALKGSIVIDHKTGFHITIALPFKL